MILFIIKFISILLNLLIEFFLLIIYINLFFNIINKFFFHILLYL